MDVRGVVGGQETTAAATAAGVLIRPDGMQASCGATWSANSPARSVAIGPGATALTMIRRRAPSCRGIPPERGAAV